MEPQPRAPESIAGEETPTALFSGSSSGAPVSGSAPYAGVSVGSVIANRYVVDGVLGQGGMGDVYRVSDRSLPGRRWALKALRPDPNEDEAEQEAQFRQEAEILCSLSHPSLPAVSAWFIEDGHHYLVMEYIEGETLFDVLERTSEPFIAEEMLRDWGLQLCDTLNYLHSQSPPVIYRDLKPRNVMLTAKGLKLIDFGIARTFEAGKASDTIVIGTPGFAAPEQYGRGQTDPRSDVYSLGATLHALATRLDPAASPFCFAVPSSINPSLTYAFDVAVLKALSLKPQDRFQTAAAFREALQSHSTSILPYLTAPSESALSLTFTPPFLSFQLEQRATTFRESIEVVNAGGRFLRARVSSNRSWLRVSPPVLEGNRHQIVVEGNIGAEKRALRYRGHIVVETDEQAFPILVSVNVQPTVWDTIIPRAGVSAFLLCQSAVPLAAPLTIPYTYVLFDGEERQVQKRPTYVAVGLALLNTLLFLITH